MKLLERLIPDELQDAVLGDLEEERISSNRSRLWYWYQVFMLLVHCFRLPWPARARKGEGFMGTLFQDVRYGTRMLVKKPSFTVVAVLTLALGIAVSSAVFSFVDAVLLKPLDYPDAEKLVVLWETFPKGGRSNPSPMTYLEWKRNNTVFEKVSIYGNTVSLNLSSNDSAEQVLARYVSADYFDMLGVQPFLGRSFAEGEDQIGNEKVVILSHRFWQRRYAGDPKILGSSIMLSQVPHLVVGILPPNGIFDRTTNDLWVPQTIRPDQIRRTTQFFNSWGRLKPGVTVAQANEDMKRMAAAYNQTAPVFWKETTAMAEPLRSVLVRPELRNILLTLMGAVLFILLIATVNVSNLMLVRATARRKEVILRVAIGAGKLRLVRQLLVESLLLALVSAIVGLLTGQVLLSAFTALIPAGVIPQQAAVSLDLRLVLFTFGIAVIAGVIFGLVPAWQATRVSLSGALQENAQSISMRAGRVQSRTLLVVEIGLTFVLVVGASLMIRSFSRLLAVDPGFDAGRVLTFKTALTPSRYPNLSNIAAYQDEFLSRIRALPGVIAAATTNALPLSDGNTNNDFNILRGGSTKPASGNASIRAVDSEYFRAIGMKLVRGRFLSRDDGANAPRAVVINQAAAKKYWADEDPVGQQIRIFGSAPYTVAGVVADIKHGGLTATIPSELYFSMVQFDESWFRFFIRSLAFVVRTTEDPMTLAGTIHSIARNMDRDQPLYATETMETVIANSVAEPRFRTILFGLFGVLAVLLAAVGIYGVISYSASQRTREIGIRMALGAKPRDIFRGVIAQGMLLALIGIVIGCGVSIWLTRLLKALWFGVTPTDIPTFVVTTAVLMTVALAGSWLPAHRAMKTDPLLAIRNE